MTTDKFYKMIEKYFPQAKGIEANSLGGGISAVTTLVSFTLEDKIKKLVIREPSSEKMSRNPNAISEHFQLLKALENSNILAPKPYTIDSEQTIVKFPYLMMEHIPGRPNSADTPTKEYLLQFATHLAQIHKWQYSQQDLAFLVKQQDILNDYFQSPPPESSWRYAPWSLMKKMLPSLEKNSSCLLHGDFWPGNILWDNQQLVGVIDWEDAHVGDPLADVSISRLDILWALGVEAMEEFTENYRRLMDINFDPLPFWDLFAALRPPSNFTTWASAYPEIGRSDVSEQSMSKGHEYFLEQALRWAKKF